ncbi:unnamed protein product [Lymnaea stagnalis]|uniref:Peptidase S1 domain-containing protein n=1 Tax=Lymnaea stagnalis TaxID=6523 RepID=A0AAV2HKI5_LYMST
MPSPRNLILLCAALAVFIPTSNAHRHNQNHHNDWHNHHDDRHNHHEPSYNNRPFTTPLYCDGTPVYTWSRTLAATSSYQACPQTFCYDYYTRNSCCMTYFSGADGLRYQQCRCGTAVLCPQQNVNTPPTTAATTTTPATTTTTPTTTPTSTTTTTTTPTTTTATTTPTTATATPTTTAISTTTAITTPTTTAPPSLCQPAFRLLNGALVDNDCAFSGISNITINNGARVTCNAVLTTATVNGILQKTFLTSSFCKNLITNAPPGIVDISIGSQNYPIQEPIFTMTDGPNGNAFITVNPRYANLLSYLGTCQKTACTYNRATMGSKVDFNDCKLISWGAHDTLKNQSGLYETSVEQNFVGCTSLPKEFVPETTVCFTTTNGQNAFCLGDSGAPLYCRARTNGEWILMGVAAYQPTCNSSPEIKVIPFPG